MSVPKSFEQVLHDWRELADSAETCRDEARLIRSMPQIIVKHETNAKNLRKCAGEAQPILDKLREEVEKMPHAAQRAIPVISMPSGMPTGEAKVCSLACSRCILERTLGERKC